MSHALQDVISPAIADGIADNKEQMIDALYPIMGGMISKYVTQAIKEMMETINKKIEQGFSVERYKRKLKAKLTGVSEGELLLEESTDAHMDAMFIIHKETGLLVSEAHLEDSQIGDPHMVASMASAIKDFINDWIADNQSEKNEIQILSYGNATLYIESAGSVYVIAFLDSEPDYEQRSEINAFFASLLKRYADFFQKFNGDDSAPEVRELSERMYTYLIEHAGEERSDAEHEEKRNPAKLIFAGLGLVLVLYGGYRIKEYYDTTVLLNRISEQTGERLSLEESDGGYLLKGALQDPAHLSEVEKISRESNLGKKIRTDLYLTIEGVKKSEENAIKKLLDVQKKEQMQERLVHERSLDTFKKEMTAKLSSLEEEQQKLKNEIGSLTKKKAALQKLLHLKEHIAEDLKQRMRNDRYYNIQKEVLDFAPLHLFEAGQSVPTKEKLDEVASSFKKFLLALKPYRPYLKKITIRSFSDSSGDAKSNLELTQERAKVVKKFLENLPVASEYHVKSILSAEGKGESDLIKKNGEEDQEASRRIEIGFVLDDTKIAQEIKELLN
jgi:outer membrane protein OmpA-like peptidoglycan-associated protein